MKKTICIVIAAIVIAAGAFAAGTKFCDIQKYIKDVPEISVSSVENVIEPSESLVTATYIYSAQESYEKSKSFYSWTVPFSTTSVTFSYSGTINVGFDTSELQITDIDKGEKTITLTMPQANILSCEIDPSSYSFEYDNQSMLSSFTMDDVPDTMDTLKEKLLQKAGADSEFLTEVNERGRKIIERILAESDVTKDYTVIWNDDGGTDDDDNEYSNL